ncbi:MAG: hypothetical protein GC204_09750 [Chloroflexi bacterium]|nr:hypothetical protein [Chloroflexota bacterium]
MTNYGILLVDTSWSNQNTAQIEKATFLRHKDLIGKGTQALIYMREPIDAIVAEAEITSDVIETEAELMDQSNLPISRDTQQSQTVGEPLIGVPNVGMANDFHVPLKLIRPKGEQTKPIALATLKSILGTDFSVFDETWIPLSEDQYNEVIALWSA